MEIVELEGGSAAGLALRGELDIAGVDAVEQRIATIAARAPHDVVLDLRQLDFIDSTGLSCLLKVYDDARAEGIRLWILPGSGPVARTLRLTGLDLVLPLVEREPDVSATGTSDSTPAAT